MIETNLIITRPSGLTFPLNSYGSVSAVTKAEQTKELMGVDTVVVTVSSARPLTFELGDTITVFGEEYTLNSLPKAIEGDKFTYDLVFEGVLYELRNAMYRDQDVSGFATSSEFDYQCTIKEAVQLIVTNVNRALGYTVLWDFDAVNCPETTTELKSFANENCLSVLQKLCQDWKLEFTVSQENGVRTIQIKQNVGDMLPYSFEKGREGGLFEFTQEYTENTLFTRLYVEGSTENIPSNYRNYSKRLKLPVASGGTESKLEVAGITRHIEATKQFDEIKPEREGSVTGIVTGDELSFVDATTGDNAMFDLNARWENTDNDYDDYLLINPAISRSDYTNTVVSNTKYLIDGTSAIVHFNSGGLAGYEFEITKYDHAAKRFTLKAFTDERGLVFPNKDNAAFQIGVNDTYVITQINLPESYITAVENRLLAAAQEYFDNGTKQKATFTIKISEMYLERKMSESGITRVFNAGDTVHVKSSRLGVDTDIRVQKFTRDVLRPYAYTLSLSDEVKVSLAQQLVEAAKVTEKVITQTKLSNVAKQRRNWKATTEIVSLYDALRAEMALISVGPEAQFQITDSIIIPNYNGDVDSLAVTAGWMYHSVYPVGNPGDWELVPFVVDGLADSDAYYLYIKAMKTVQVSEFYLTDQKMELEEIPGYYLFPVGILSSVINGARSFQMTKGYTLISGENVTTGVIQSADGGVIIDLNNGTITGKISFLSGGETKDLDTQVSQLQNQIDGVIIAWFKEYDPTTLNVPASEWDTEALKNQHANDTFTNTSSGHSWRWVYATGATPGWMWSEIVDTATVQALAKAGEALTAAQNAVSAASAAQQSADAANNLLADIASDSKLTASEKQSIKKEWDAIVSEKVKNDAQADAFGVSKTAYVTAYTALSDYITPLLADLDTTSDITGATFRSTFKAYYDARTDLLNAIAAKAKAIADNATTVANNAKPAADNAAEAASNASGAVTSLNTYVDGAFKDGVIDSAEAKAIEKYTNQVNAAWSDFESTYNVVYANSYLEGDSKTALLNAKINLVSAKNNLLNSISTAIADGKTSVEEKADVDSKFATYNSNVASFKTALENANKAIQAKLDALSAGRITDEQANTAAAKIVAEALGNPTSVEGGLILTTLIKMMTGGDTGEETAGMSAGTGDDVAFWAGGTLQQSIQKLTNFGVKHNGDAWFRGQIEAISGKFGFFNILGNNISASNIAFSNEGLEDLADIGGSSSDLSLGANNDKTVSYPNSSVTSSVNNIIVNKNSRLLFNLVSSVQGLSGAISGLVKITEASGSVIFNQSYSTIINQNITVDLLPGVYTIEFTVSVSTVYVSTVINSKILGWNGASTMSLVPMAALTKLATNGMYNYWGLDAYLYHRAGDGLSFRGAIDMPGGLGGGSVNSSGYVTGGWGKYTPMSSKSSATVTITHGIGNTDYMIWITPTSNITYYITNKQANTIQIVMSSTSGTFDFTLIRAK